ncbi:MAG: response regulator [Deltaproteobacteria bacterium]
MGPRRRARAEPAVAIVPSLAPLVAVHTAIAALSLGLFLSMRRDRRLRAEQREEFARALDAKTEEIERTEVALVNAERQSTLGRIAAGVAHEVNNPAGVILGNLDQLRRRIDVDDESTRRSVSECIEGIRRIQAIVSALQALTGTDEDPKVPARFESVVEAALLVGAPSVPSGVEIQRRLEPVGTFDMRPGTLMRVVLDLAAHAADCIAPGEPGCITVALRREGDFAALEVHDDTTPERAVPETHSRQLRLEVVRGALRSLDGTLTLSARGGDGLTRTARVPLPATRTVPASAPAAQPERTDVVRAKILLIDDEPAMLRVLGRVIARSHTVYSARSGEVALALVDQHGATLDLILCDVILAGTNGVTLREAVAARVPSLAGRFVFMTGGGADRALRARLEATGVPLLEKPLEPDALLEFITARVTSRQSVPDPPP